MKYYKQEDWERALFVFSGAGVMPVYEGLCHLFLGDKKKAFDVWWKKALTMFNLHVIASECIEHDIHDTAAEYYLTFPSKGWQFGEFYFERKSLPWAVMETYFGEHPDRLEEESRWGRFLVAGDSGQRNKDEIFRFLGRAGDYVGLAIYVFAYIKPYDEKLYKAIIHHYKTRGPGFEEEGDYGGAAFCYMILERFDQLERCRSRVTITPVNFCLFLEGNDDIAKREEVYQWSIDNDCRTELREYLVAIEDREKLEELYKYEAGINGKEYKNIEWDWAFERSTLYLEKLRKYKNDGDYSFFYRQDLQNLKTITDEYGGDVDISTMKPPEWFDESEFGADLPDLKIGPTEDTEK